MNEVHERTALYLAEEANDEAVLSAARRIIDRRFLRQGVINKPEDAYEMLRLRIAGEPREVMIALYLDARHQVIAIRDEFFGTVHGCTIHARELAREALRLNASALILAHNHPSGTSEPSLADRELTERVRTALALLDIRLLDHLVMGADVMSFADRGFL